MNNPTHEVSTRYGSRLYSVELTLSDSVVANMTESTLAGKKARDHVCIRFKLDVASDYSVRLGHVEWKKLRLKPIVKVVVEHPCTCPDSCVLCDLGQCERCKNCSRL